MDDYTKQFPLPMSNELDVAFIAMHEMFLGLMRGGFTESQALRILGAQMAATTGGSDDAS